MGAPSLVSLYAMACTTPLIFNLVSGLRFTVPIGRLVKSPLQAIPDGLRTAVGRLIRQGDALIDKVDSIKVWWATSTFLDESLT